MEGRLGLDVVRRQIASVTGESAKPRTPTGCDAIDAALGGGLDRGALHEVAAADHRATPAALGFLLALTAILAPTGPLFWPLAHGDFGAPYPPGLKAQGLDPARIVFALARSREEQLWAMEEALRLKAVAAVTGTRPARMDLTMSRRLQLAAEAACAPILLLRPHKDDELSAAVTRWRIAPLPASRDAHGFFARPRFAVALERARGGRQGEWAVEFDHAALCLRLSADVPHRALSAGRAQSAA